MSHLQKCYLSVFILTIVVFCVSCEETNDFDNGFAGSAIVHVRITGDAANAVDRVALTLSGVGISPAIVGNMERENDSWFADVRDIPTGANNRIVRASAFDSSGVLLADLSVEQVTIAISRSAEIFLYLNTGVRNGSGSLDSAPVIDGLSTSSVEAFTDEVITLTVKAHDPGSDDALQYTWSADGGFFYSANSAIASWKAPSKIGPYKIWVTVSDSTGRQISTSLSVSVVNIPKWSL